MDTECKGDRVCDAGQCVSPPSASAPMVEQPSGSAVRARPPTYVLPLAEEKPIRMETTRRSKPLMVGGIVTTALAPGALLLAYITFLQKSMCVIDHTDYSYSSSSSSSSSAAQAQQFCDDKYDTRLFASLGAAAGFVLVGVPMIVIGAKSVPVNPRATQEAAIGPWVTPTAAGLSLRLKM
jgi:hypothetical protein